MAVMTGFAVLAPFAAQAETLSEALAEAYGTNPDLAAERARVRAVDEQVPQALSNWRPQVVLSSRYGVRKLDRETGAGVETDRTDQPRSVGLAVTQNLFRGFRTQAETDRAENRVEAARSNLIGTEQSVLLEGVAAYVTVLRDSAVLDLRTNNVGVIEQQSTARRSGTIRWPFSSRTCHQIYRPPKAMLWNWRRTITPMSSLPILTNARRARMLSCAGASFYPR
jgi:outer membrane protein